MKLYLLRVTVLTPNKIFSDMRLCYGWSKKDFYMSSEKRYVPEQLYERLKPFVPSKAGSQTASLLNVPLWVKIDSEFVRIEGLPELNLACKLVTIYHNTDCRAPLSDGWEDETLEMEARAAGILGSESSEEDTGKVEKKRGL